MSDLFTHLLSPEPDKKKSREPEAETNAVPEDKKQAELSATEHEPESIPEENHSEEVLPEGEEERLYFSIGEVAEKFKVAPSLLRFWEKEFEQLNPKKNAKGTRFYTKHNIETISLIYYLVKERGYTLQGAREKLKSGKMSSNNLEVVNTLKNIRALLLEIKTDLDQD